MLLILYIVIMTHWYLTQEPVEWRLGQSLHRRKTKGRKRLKLDWDCAYDIPLLASLHVLSNDEILQEVNFVVVDHAYNDINIFSSCYTIKKNLLLIVSLKLI